jgi:hypothetical protein
MKKLLTILFIGFSTIRAQELTANTPAADPTLLEQILQALWAGLAVLIGLFVRKAIPLLNAYLKQIMHFRGASVVVDALTEALADMSAEVQKALADGVITPAEKAALKLKAREIAKARLQNLSGFYKRDLAGWIDEQLNVALSKLLARTLG